MSRGRLRPGRRAAAAAALLAVALTLACGGGPRRTGEAPSPLPDRGPVAGWHPEGPAEPVSADGLYQRIDGGAELFLQAGFERLLVRDYTGGGEEIEAQLFVLTSPDAARAVWERQGGGGGAVEGLPGPARSGRYQLAALLGRCYLVVDNLSGGTAARPAMEALARTIASSSRELCGW